MRGHRALVVTSLAFAAGCSLLVETSGLGGPVVDSPTDGGGGPTADATPTTQDGGAADVDPRDGAAPEASAETALCGTPSLWCTTFDEGLAAFSTTHADPGTTLTIDATGGTSGAAVKLTAGRTNAVQDAYGAKTLPNVRQDVRIRFAMRVDPIMIAVGDRGTHFAQFKMDLPSSKALVTMELLVDRTIAVYVESAGNGAYFGAGPVEMGTWQRFDLTFGPTTRRFRLVRNGVTEVDRSDLTALPAGTPTFYEVLFGVLALNVPNAPVTFRFDDVRVDAL